MTTAQDAVYAARRMLDHAHLGLRDFRAGGERRLPGLYQAVTSARSVTFALQTMRGHVTGFEDWYAEVEAGLRADAVAKWFVELRNRIEKRGDHGRSTPTARIQNVDGALMARMNERAPEGTIATFLADELGRSGWLVHLPGGEEIRVYFTPPPGVVVSDLRLHGAPDGREVGSLLQEQLDKLTAIVDDAERAFC